MGIGDAARPSGRSSFPPVVLAEAERHPPLGTAEDSAREGSRPSEIESEATETLRRGHQGSAGDFLPISDFVCEEDVQAQRRVTQSRVRKRGQNGYRSDSKQRCQSRLW